MSFLGYSDFQNHNCSAPYNEFIKEFTTLKNKLNPFQKIFLVADAHWIPDVHGQVRINPEDLKFIARNYFELANADTSVVGILNYFWPNGFDDPLESRGLPKEVMQEQQLIGKIITGKP